MDINVKSERGSFLSIHVEAYIMENLNLYDNSVSMSNSNSVEIALYLMKASGIKPSIRHAFEKGVVLTTKDQFDGNSIDFPSDEEQVIISLLNKLGCCVYHVLRSEYEIGFFVGASTSFMCLPTADLFPGSFMDEDYGELVAKAEFGFLHAFTVDHDIENGESGSSSFGTISVSTELGRLIRVI
jgi:hypothetical protein